MKELSLSVLFVKKKIKELSKNNNCTHKWITVLSGQGFGVMCVSCGELLYDSLSKSTADSICRIGNSVQSNHLGGENGKTQCSDQRSKN